MIMRCQNLLKGILTVCLLNTTFITLSPAVYAQPEATPQTEAKQDNGLTEAKITEVLKAIEQAEEKKDVLGMSKFLAPFVSADIMLKTAHSSNLTELVGKDQLVNFVNYAWKNIQARKNIQRQVNIEILEDGQFAIATVRTIREVSKTDGKQYYSSTENIIHFAMMNNQPMIVLVKTEGWLGERPNAQPSK